MQQFTDNQGQVWNLSIDIPARKRIREDAGFDVYAVVETGVMEKLEDPETLVAVLYSACKEQVTKAGLTPEQFAARFTGDVLDDASVALIKAITDFFPSRRRAVMTEALAKGLEIQAAQTAKAIQQIKATPVDRIDLSPPPTLNGSSTSSPESWESTRALQI